MQFHDEAIDAMAKEKSSAKKKVRAAILAILLAADKYRHAASGGLSPSDIPELDDEVNRILIELSDSLKEDAERRAKSLLETMGAGEWYDEVVAEAEEGDQGLVWALDMHCSNLKRLLEAWVAIMFASALSVNQAYSKVIVYMDKPEASKMWRDAVRSRVVDPDEVRFGRGYQRRVADAIAVLLQTLIYTVFVKAVARKGREDGAVGYRTFRQSNYDCPLCDSLTTRIWPLDTMVVPAHPRCVCGIELVYPGED